MALGGGTFTAQDRILPGTYLNFISATRTGAGLSERGIGALPIELDFGPEDVFTLDSSDRNFLQDVRRLTGYDWWHERTLPFREFFRMARVGHFYRLGTGGTKASNAFATANYPGVRGNDIQIIIEAGEASGMFFVTTTLGTEDMGTQLVSTASDLVDNDLVTWDTSATLELTAGTPLTGGTNGTVTNGDYQAALNRLESYTFNTIACPSSEDTVKALFAAYTVRMRDEVGAKFQCVVHRYPQADFEGVVSVENNDTPELVYWAAGALAGCAINQSLTNRPYDCEIEVSVDYTSDELESAITGGRFILHKVGEAVHVLMDINTLTTFTGEKNQDFSSNQVIRVIDQIAIDTAALFATRYLGIVPNDQAGRMSLWGDLVSNRKDLERLRAIEDFDPEHITVAAGDVKHSVVVTDRVTPVSATTHLYMTVIVA